MCARWKTEIIGVSRSGSHRVALFDGSEESEENYRVKRSLPVSDRYYQFFQQVYFWAVLTPGLARGHGLSLPAMTSQSDQ